MSACCARSSAPLALALQAMIKEGLIDLDGFDDFRVVIGENSLVQR